MTDIHIARQNTFVMYGQPVVHYIQCSASRVNPFKISLAKVMIIAFAVSYGPCNSTSPDGHVVFMMDDGTTSTHS